MTSDLSQLGFLLFVSALVAMLTRRLHLPYTVGLVLAGMALYFSHVYIKWHLTKDLIFSVFLPPLVFEAALFIHWRDFKKELPVVTLLATAGVVLAAAVTAVGMHYALAWDWGSAIVFGVLIAATDPVSVIATFKESKAHGRLRTLIESESLLNDGTAAVAFVAALGVLAGGHETVFSITGALFVTIIGGVLIGGIIAYLFMLLAGRTPDYLVEITFTTLAAYGSFFVAEHFQCSGVLAALTAGLDFGCRTARLRAVLGVCGVCRQFSDLSADRRARSAAAFQRSLGTGVARYCLSNARSCGYHLSAVRLVCPQSTQGGYAASARAFLGRAAGRFGARSVVIPARGSSAARSHRRDYLCRGGILCVCARTDDYPALTPPGANQIATKQRGSMCRLYAL
jgi:Sodium/hydrogen exchanger family